MYSVPQHCAPNHDMKKLPPFSRMLPLAFILVTLLYPYLVVSQYIQDFQTTVVNGKLEYTWRRTPKDTPEVVLSPEAPDFIRLEYNCYYMPAICQNVDNWYQKDSGRAYGINANRPDPNIFAYDLGTSNMIRSPRKQTHSKARRNKQCPNPKWRKSAANACPAAGQPKIMPGPWMFTDLETANSLNANEIKAWAMQLPGSPKPTLMRSGRYYSCDEFPPASWVQGGVGLESVMVPEGSGAAGTTRCAPQMMTCGSPKVASEQDWQGRSHSLLYYRLVKWAKGKGYRIGDSTAALFTFNKINDPNAPPARIVWYDPAGPPNHDKPVNVRHDISDAHSSDANARLPDVYEVLLSLEDERHKDKEEKHRLSDDITTGPDGEVFVLTAEMKAAGDTVRTAATSDAGSAFVEEPFHNSSVLYLAAMDFEAIMAIANESSPTHRTGPHQQRYEPVPDILQVGTNYMRGLFGPFSEQALDSSVANASEHIYTKRDALTCSAQKPCVDDSCCSKEGKCGYKKQHCSIDLGCQNNCNATAMCGIDSKDKMTTCGLKLCCSYYGWCGTENVHCIDPEPQFGKTPCQEGFGSCKMTASPVCNGQSASNGRKVGYYQSWNTRDRKCDKVYPRDINTRGLTHLFFAFVFFHPTTFELAPMDPGDVLLMGQFTALKRGGLQTWVAVGGWSFNDPGPTQMAYTNMVSTAANRATFIHSLIRFMEKYGFQGADIDWEYPGEPKRGGRKQDGDNLVLLFKEMKQAFGGRFGISLTLAPDYWYLRGFRPAAMQEYVDFMGFMAYDLHGAWDTDVKTLGSYIRPQTDITEIDKNLIPLWFDGVDPAKINLGMAFYGRTYELADPSCASMGCKFKFNTTGAAGECTGFSGVLSNREIQRMIKKKGYKPYFNSTAMVKYFTYDDKNWVGYDDAQTLGMKEAFANSRCLGGLMWWSVDFEPDYGAEGLYDGHRSPDLATIVPMAHTTVLPKATFTLNSGAHTDIASLPNAGFQNQPVGPQNCERCSFFRLLTATCCGRGGSIGNPIELPAMSPVPMDIPLPPGFVPNQPFVGKDGTTQAAGVPLLLETILPEGTIFTAPFKIPSEIQLREGEGEDAEDGSLVWVDPKIWEDPHPQIGCLFPCTLVIPPYTKTTNTIDYPLITINTEGYESILTQPPMTVSAIYFTTIVISAGRGTSVVTVSPSASTNTTWPFAFWYDGYGTQYTTIPPGPPPTITHQIPTPILTVTSTTPYPTTRPWPDPCCDDNKRKCKNPPCKKKKPNCLFPPCPVDDNDNNKNNNNNDNDCMFPPCLKIPACPFPPCTPIPPICLIPPCRSGCLFPPCPKPIGGGCLHPPCVPKPNPNDCLNPPCPPPRPPPPAKPSTSSSAEGQWEPSDGHNGENEPDEYCSGDDDGYISDGNGASGSGPSSGSGSQQPAPEAPEGSTPNGPATHDEPGHAPLEWGDATLRCYNSGLTTTHKWMLTAIDRFCSSMDGKTIQNGEYTGDQHNYAKVDDPWLENEDIDLIISVEVRKGCSWTIVKSDCESNFKIPVNQCDTSSTGHKQGGTLESKCVYLRIDPNNAISGVALPGKPIESKRTSTARAIPSHRHRPGGPG